MGDVLSVAGARRPSSIWENSHLACADEVFHRFEYILRRAAGAGPRRTDFVQDFRPVFECTPAEGAQRNVADLPAAASAAESHNSQLANYL